MGNICLGSVSFGCVCLKPSLYKPEMKSTEIRNQQILMIWGSGVLMTVSILNDRLTHDRLMGP